MEEHVVDLTGIAFVMAIAAMLGFVLMRFRQPPIVGYILAGVVLGPTGFGLVENAGSITVLAELGVIMLLFLIGMELSVRVFATVAGIASIVTAGQIAASLGVAALLGLAFGWDFEAVVALGFIVAISSTAVAMQMLEELGELRTATGRITVGVLIAQDIAVVPMLVILSSFGSDSDLTGLVIKLAIAAILIFALLRYLSTRPGKLRLPFTERMSGRVDMVALASVAFCFGAAALTSVAGLSAAFGAFLAGLVIAGSTMRAEAIAATHPIQSLLIVVFFLSIGLLIDLDYVIANLGTVIVVVIAVLAAKTFINVLLLRLVRTPWEQAFPGGLIMAQVGEFSFVLAASGLISGAVSQDTYRLAIAVIAISLLVSPLWMVSLRRFQVIAHHGVTNFREALAEVYAGEIGEIERGRLMVSRGALYARRRARAARIAWQRRRRARRHPAASTARPEPGEAQVADAGPPAEDAARPVDPAPISPESGSTKAG
ncbi:cation:proton antiporter [Bauldia litoralis]|uniref:Monovalent cation:H+ antiporter-2, CPA2 family n=1 Tax=Bauldia litoralis TaxID=665467 RepID=A0A1G6CDD1_9HYPH|nr:cation:proton antiporter [Bauldia litoralis]SDB30888.1 monovalent cation:H+ antiporter-2, CPA2 family [Bauldia litoralis]